MFRRFCLAMIFSIAIATIAQAGGFCQTCKTGATAYGSYPAKAHAAVVVQQVIYQPVLVPHSYHLVATRTPSLADELTEATANLTRLQYEAARVLIAAKNAESVPALLSLKCDVVANSQGEAEEMPEQQPGGATALSTTNTLNFATSCASCHGSAESAKAHGEKEFHNFAALGDAKERWRIAERVKNGEMPPENTYTPEQRAQLAAKILAGQ